MIDAKIKLIKENKQKDNCGISKVISKVETEVYAKIDSVTTAEFFRAGTDRLRPAFRFTVYSAEYNNQRLIKYNGNLYSIYRTYQPTIDTIELYAATEVGKNG